MISFIDSVCGLNIKYTNAVQRSFDAVIFALLFGTGLMSGYGFNESHTWALPIVIIISYYTHKRKKTYMPVDLQFILLCIVYYFIAVYQQINTPNVDIAYSVTSYAWIGPMVYLLGKIIVSDKSEKNKVFFLIFFLGIGMYIQGLLNYYHGFDDVELHRYYYSVWKSFWNNEIDGTRTLWNFGFLIINSGFVYGIIEKKRVFTIVSTVLIVVSISLDTYFRGRTLTVVTVLTFILFIVLFYLNNNLRGTIKIISSFMVVFITLYTLYHTNFMGVQDYLSRYGFLKRDGGIFHNVRIELWKSGLKSAFDNQKGGWSLQNAYNLDTPHNTWLELARYYDIIVFLLWCIFLILTIYTIIITLTKYGNEYKILYWVSASIFSIFLVSMSERYLAERMELLLVLLFLSGIVSGIREAASTGEYGIINGQCSYIKTRYLFLGLGILSFAFITCSYMDWWNDRMELLLAVIIPTIVYVFGGLIFNKKNRIRIIVLSAMLSGIAAVYMYVISIKSEYFSLGLYTELFTNNSVDKSVYLALWILPISLLIGTVLYLTKLNKTVASLITLIGTSIITYPYISDGRLVYIKEAIRLQLGMESGLQWIASKENYLGILTSHSMWLDYARDYGMIVFGLLMVFELWSIYCFLRMIRNGRKNLVDYVLIVSFILFNFQFMFEASAITSKYIFAIGLFIYGMVTSAVVVGEQEQGLYDSSNTKCYRKWLMSIMEHSC